jgi:malonyl-CoA/methylmalonyl-CoA synthetase
MSSNNLFSALRAAFPRDLEQIAVETTSAAGEPLRYTWRDLDRASARIANLLASLELPEGSRVAVQVDKSVEAMLLYLGTLRAGYVFLPLNTAYQSAEIEYFVGNAEPAVVVCAPANFGWVSKIAFTSGVAHVYTLGDDLSGTLLERAAHHGDAHRWWRAARTTWPPSSTPAAPRAAARGPSSRTATCCPTPRRSRTIGAGRTVMC